MCRLRNVAMRDYQKSVTTEQTHGQTDRRTDRQTPDKVIPMCRYASQATQKLLLCIKCSPLCQHAYRGISHPALSHLFHVVV